MTDVLYGCKTPEFSQKTCSSGMSFRFCTLDNRFFQVIRFQRIQLVSNSATQNFGRSRKRTKLFYFLELKKQQARKISGVQLWLNQIDNKLFISTFLISPNTAHFFFSFCVWLWNTSLCLILADDSKLQPSACFSGSLLFCCPEENKMSKHLFTTVHHFTRQEY